MSLFESPFERLAKQYGASYSAFRGLYIVSLPARYPVELEIRFTTKRAGLWEKLDPFLKRYEFVPRVSAVPHVIALIGPPPHFYVYGECAEKLSQLVVLDEDLCAALQRLLCEDAFTLEWLKFEVVATWKKLGQSPGCDATEGRQMLTDMSLLAQRLSALDPQELGAYNLPEDGWKVRLFRSLISVWIPVFFISIPFLFLFGLWLYTWPLTHHH